MTHRSFTRSMWCVSVLALLTTLAIATCAPMACVPALGAGVVAKVGAAK